MGATGVVTIRSASPASAREGSRSVGCAGVVAGFVVLFHERLDNVVAQSVLFRLLATVILLTGLAHVLKGSGPATRLSARLLARASCSE